MTIGGVLLAAGRGSRFHGPHHKLLAPLRGRPLAAWSIDALLGAGLDETAIVTGAVDVGWLVPPSMQVLENPRWSEGLATSLQAGVRWARARGHDVLVVGLADTPGVPSRAWQSVAASGARVAVARFHGRRCPPIRLDSDLWSDLPLTGDIGARGLWDVVGSETIDVEGDPFDVDSVDDLAEADRRLSDDGATA